MLMNRLPQDVPSFQGHAIIPSATPDEIIDAFMQVLGRCALPTIFQKGSVLTTNRWMPQIDDERDFPKITWKIVHTTTSEKLPKEVLICEQQIGTTSLSTFQQLFLHIVQFECFAQTQEQVSALEWWLVRQLILYRVVLADAGAQHLRYHEGREDLMSAMPRDKYPGRAVRFSFQSAMTFTVVRTPLDGVTVSTAIQGLPLTNTTDVVRGEDILTVPGILGVLAVTSQDGKLGYAPQYDPTQQAFSWAPDQLQPALGDSYVVTYLYTGTDGITAVI